jgi:hypothetical protein
MSDDEHSEFLLLVAHMSGAIYISTTEALKDKLGVTQPRLNTLLKKLHHMAVASLNRIWDQRWAMINNHLQLEGAKRAPWLNGHHQNTLRSTTKNNRRRRRRGDNANKSSQLPPKQPGSGMTPESTPCRLLGPTGMVDRRRGDLFVIHAYLPSLNYAGSNVQPSVTTHSLTVV